MANTKRSENWWEPIFSETPIALNSGDWSSIPRNASALSFRQSPASSPPVKIKNKCFDCCDFEGDFSDKVIVFDECKFKKCDFGKSRWKYARFRNCEFILTSFSISTFDDCEFRDCTFERIGISGNTTIIPKTLITNPMSFIRAADVFKDQIPSHISVRYQRAQLRLTQSNLARILMDNLSKEGSEESYYEAVKCRTLMAARARYANALVKLYGRRRKIDFWSLTIRDIFGFLKVGGFALGGAVEGIILRAIGGMNAWGASISRSVAIGMIFMTLTSVSMRLIQNDISWSSAFFKTCEIFFLFGFTNYTANLELPHLERALCVGVAIFGLVWYAVFITTVINKLTRQR